MNEDRKRDWDVRLGFVAPVLTLLSVVIGVWQFNAGEENRRREGVESARLKDDIEFRRKLWLEKLERYRGLSELAGKIVSMPKGKARDAAVQDFKGQYWGAMILVEDKAAEEAMVGFYLELEDERTGWSVDPDRLKARADILIKACRLSIEAGSSAALSAGR